MKKINLSPKIYLVASLIFAGAMMRLIPHWPNFTPIAAIALTGGAFIKRKEFAFLLPISAMLLSDLILGLHATMLVVYLSFAAIVGIGMLLKRKLTVVNTLASAVAAATLFFLTTNFAVWASGMMPYAKNFSGLMQSYVAGLPFFLNQIAGDLFYTGIIFGIVYFVSKPKMAVAE